MTELPDPEPSAEHENSFLRGLGLDRLQPGNALAFFAGLPNRAADLTRRSTSRSDAEARALVTQQREVLEQIADEMNRLIAIVKGHGYPLDPSVHVEPSAGDEAAISSTRISAASNELVQRLTGVAPDEWGAAESTTNTLLSDTRTAIGRIAQLLRALQQMNPDMDDSDGSAEALPSDASEIQSARDDIESLTQSISSERPISAPGSATVGCSPGEAAPGEAGFDGK